MGTTLLPSLVRGQDVVHLSSWSSIPPVIDGALDTETEWVTADRAEFQLGSTYAGNLYVMNDAANLYLGLEIADDDYAANFSTRDIAFFYFDNDNDGSGPEAGDDSMGCTNWATTEFDQFYNGTSASWLWDRLNGGTNDGFSATGGNGTHNFFEIAHLLNSTDDPRDFSLRVGDTIGFMLRYADNNAYVGQWPSDAHPNLPPTHWHKIRIAAPPMVIHGDLLLAGNNVTVLAGVVDINGSIIVEENATLILRNAFLRVEQAGIFKQNITLQNPLNGTPRLLAFNSSIRSTEFMYLYLLANSTSIVSNSTIENIEFLPRDNSTLHLSMSAALGLEASGSSIVNLSSSTLYSISARGKSRILVHDSEITHVHVRANSVQCRIEGLEVGFTPRWSFNANCSLTILLEGLAPNLTVVDTSVVGSWGFTFSGQSNVSFESSTIGQATGLDNAVFSLKSTRCQNLDALYASVFTVADSAISDIYATHSSSTWLLNSTYASVDIQHAAKVYFSWHVDVQVVDSLGRAVSSAAVEATYPNSTVADLAVTDGNGSARLVLVEKVVNQTGTYTAGNYTITADYLTYSNSTSVTVTGNRQVTLQLTDLIPEFPPLIVMPLVIALTLLAAVIHRKRILSEPKKSEATHAAPLQPASPRFAGILRLVAQV
jgi:hypothetical protein